jgi:hypothetical protein
VGHPQGEKLRGDAITSDRGKVSAQDNRVNDVKDAGDTIEATVAIMPGEATVLAPGSVLTPLDVTETLSNSESPGATTLATSTTATTVTTAAEVVSKTESPGVTTGDTATVASEAGEESEDADDEEDLHKVRLT